MVYKTDVIDFPPKLPFHLLNKCIHFRQSLGSSCPFCTSVNANLQTYVCSIAPAHTPSSPSTGVHYAPGSPQSKRGALVWCDICVCSQMSSTPWALWPEITSAPLRTTTSHHATRTRCSWWRSTNWELWWVEQSDHPVTVFLITRHKTIKK